MIKLMIFDHDMTIVDSSHAILAGLNLVAEAVGRPRATHAQVMRYIAMPMREFMIGTLGDCRPEWLEMYRDKVAPLEHSMIRPFPETRTILPRLREMGLILAVASNRNAPHVKTFFAAVQTIFAMCRRPAIATSCVIGPCICTVCGALRRHAPLRVCLPVYSVPKIGRAHV